MSSRPCLLLVTGMLSPVDHGFINSRAAFQNGAVNRNLFAHAHAQAVTFGNEIDLNFLVGAVLADTACDLGAARIEERGWRPMCSRAPQLQDLAEDAGTAP